jgi:hypothetical protein
MSRGEPWRAARERGTRCHRRHKVVAAGAVNFCGPNLAELAAAVAGLWRGVAAPDKAVSCRNQLGARR